MPIYGQVGLFSLAAFAFGVLFTWLAMARPLRRRVAELEEQAERRPEPYAAAAPAGEPAADPVAAGTLNEFGQPPARSHGDPQYRTAVFGTFPATEQDDALSRERFEPSHIGGTAEPDNGHRSFFDEPERSSFYDDMPAAQAPVEHRASSPATGIPDAGDDAAEESEQDAAYFAYLQQVRSGAPDGGASTAAESIEDESKMEDAKEDDAVQRGALRLSTPDSPAEEQSDLRTGAPAERAQLQEDAPTQVLQPINADLLGDPAEVAGTPRDESEAQPAETAQAEASAQTGEAAESGLVRGELSGHLDGAQPLPAAPVKVTGTEAAAEQAPEQPPDQPAAQPDTAPTAEAAGTDSGAAPDDPAPEQSERTRALFEPALQPTFADEFEETTHMAPIVLPAAEQAAAEQVAPSAWSEPQPGVARPVPTGPFGPGSALPQPDGSAPSPEFVVKARTSSMVFHTTSSPFYDRLLPQVWFRSAEEAMRAGFTSWERPEGSWGTS